VICEMAYDLLIRFFFAVGSGSAADLDPLISPGGGVVLAAGHLSDIQRITRRRSCFGWLNWIVGCLMDKRCWLAEIFETFRNSTAHLFYRSAVFCFAAQFKLRGSARFALGRLLHLR